MSQPRSVFPNWYWNLLTPKFSRFSKLDLTLKLKILKNEITFFAIFVEPLSNQKYLFLIIVEVFHLDLFQKPRTFEIFKWTVRPTVHFYLLGPSTFKDFIWNFSFQAPNYHDWFPLLSFFQHLFSLPM